MSEDQHELHIVRGHALRDLSDRDLDSLKNQIETEILKSTVEGLKSLYDQLDLVERELWQRN
jgi:hypothetical protein